MRLAVAASPEVAIPSLEAILSSEHELVRIFSQPDRPAGRGRTLTPTPVSAWAQEHEIDLVRPSTAAEMRGHLSDIDCVVTIGYGLLLPEDILSIPRHGFINLHFSLLPRWRGAAPVQRAIEAGDKLTGVTVFQLDAGMDTGPIYVTHRFALDDDITSDELFVELGELGVGAVLETLAAIEAGVRPVPQNGDGATRAYKLSREQGRINWNQEVELISAHIRAFTSAPGAWTIFRGEPLKVSAVSVSQISLNPGEVSLQGKKLFIGTATTALEVGIVIPNGKGSMKSLDWANGARLVDGEQCE
jgi:methionyl-tRNA formyltransferase